MNHTDYLRFCMNCGHTSDINNEKYCDYNNGIFHPQKISELKTCPKIIHALQEVGGMTNEQKLKKAKNLIRYIIRETYPSFDDHCRDDITFFNRVVNDGIDIGIIEEDKGINRLTDYEPESKSRRNGSKKTINI